MFFVSNSEAETKKLAKDLVQKYRNRRRGGCLVFALIGDLGSGKTVFAKGVGEVLGIKEPIRSPSFVLVREYSGLSHVDLWRVESGEELLALKLDREIKPGNIVVIEWAEKAKNFLGLAKARNNVTVVTLQFSHGGGGQREIKIEEK